MSSYDFKVVLMGQEDVGKTSLVLRFVTCSFNPLISNTVGATFCVKTMQSNGKDYNIGIWDTAGSERFQSMMPLYYRGAKAAIICYEPTSAESWRRLRHWLCELRTVEETCKIYLCGTKKDLLDDKVLPRQVSEDIVASYSRDLNGHYLISSKTGENIEELFQKIVDDCAKDPNLMKVVDEKRVQLQNGAACVTSKEVCPC